MTSGTRKMTKVYFNGITEMGSCITNAMVVVPEDYTMSEIVRAIKANGYRYFLLEGMRRYAEVI